MYKFSTDKALRWMERKHKRIADCLEIQMKQKEEDKKTSYRTKDTFFMPEDPMAEPTTAVNSVQDAAQKRLRIESLEIIQEYLPSNW